MKQLVFSDAQYWHDFLPLTFTKPIAEIRVGILTFKERWQKLLGYNESFYVTEKYLQGKYPEPTESEVLLIVPNFIPSDNVLQLIKNLKKGEALVYKDEVIASYIDLSNFNLGQIDKMTEINEELTIYEKSYDIFTYNEQAILYDFNLLTKNRKSNSIPETNFVTGNKEDIFVEDGAKINYAYLNATAGPIYIGKNSEIMEGAMLRGPIAICNDSTVNMGAKIYGATTFGPHVKVGGEVGNSVILGYSNKAHDGYLGKSVVGEWCNIGADTNSSNLKINYGFIKLWSYREHRFTNTGLQFCGTIMGDHSKTAINMQLNTGTVVGVCANIFREGFTPNLVKNFSWGGRNNDTLYKLDKAYETAKTMMARRNIELTEDDKLILKYIFENF